MSLSIQFWTDTLVSLTLGVVALALLLLALGMGLRRRLNQIFSLFTACAALIGFGSAIVNIVYWINLQLPDDKGKVGNPLFWMELATAGFYFVGPALLAFAITYIESLADSEGLIEEGDQTLRLHTPPLYKIVALFGFLIGLGLLPAIFGHRIVSQIYTNEANITHPRITNLGYAALVGPLIFQTLALILFWRHRQRPGGMSLTVATALWTTGNVVIALIETPFPTGVLALTISIAIVGYAVTSLQLFNPLQTLTHQLEATVAERTQDLQRARDRLGRLNEQYRRIAQISREIAQAATPAGIVDILADKVHNRLGYHHVFVYQPDKASRSLVIQAAAGATAKTTMERRHRLRIGGRSLTGQVAVERRPRIINAQDHGDMLFVDTALPGARAEIAVPLLAGDRLLGVLDIQSIHWDAFSEQDLTALNTLADQAGVTLDNARLLQETEVALAEAEKIQRQQLRQAWQSTLGGPEHAPAYFYSESDGVKPSNLHTVRSPEITQAVAQKRALTSTSDEGRTVALPIVLRGQIIGVLQLTRKAGQGWQPQDVKVLKDVSERLGLALEAVRLSEETQRRANREQLTHNITEQMQQTADTQAVIQNTLKELQSALGASYAVVHMGTEQELLNKLNGDIE